jgi:hypothetical protein
MGKWQRAQREERQDAERLSWSLRIYLEEVQQSCLRHIPSLNKRLNTQLRRQTSRKMTFGGGPSNQAGYRSGKLLDLNQGGAWFVSRPRVRIS